MRLRRLKFGFARVEESLGTFRGETFEVWVSFNSTCRSASEWDNEVADHSGFLFALSSPYGDSCDFQLTNWRRVHPPVCGKWIRGGGNLVAPGAPERGARGFWLGPARLEARAVHRACHLEVQGISPLKAPLCSQCAGRVKRQTCARTPSAL
jgi:hypothetical protein